MKRVKYLILIFALTTFSICILAENSAIVRYLEGKAYVQGASSEERELLTINSPIFAGDNIWLTEGNIGILFTDGTIIWLSTDSHIEISQFPYPYSEKPLGLKASLWRGMAVLEAKFPVPTESSHIIMTPSASVRTARKSLAIIEVENVDRTRLTVLDGSAIISSGGYSNTVWANQMSYAQYGYEPSAPVSVGKIAYPEIIAFREQMTNRPARTPKSWEYLDPELQAYATDLDYYGYWEDVPGYGHVWFPSPAYVYYGWTPYFNGYWRYTPWGCTWISYDPWGWVPFHYGNWTFIIGVGWGWIPDVWFSPAWVAWYWWDGWIGWCPWGYYRGYWGPIWEPCGWYRVDINNIYVTNVTKIAVVNKNGPPPVKPVVPVPKKALNVDQNFAKKFSKDSDVFITHSGGLNIRPSKIHDLKNGKVTFDDIKQTLAEPPVIAKKNVMPTSLDRNDGDIRTIKDRDIPSPSTPNRTPMGDSPYERPSRTSPPTRAPITDSDENFPKIDRDEPAVRGRNYDSDRSISPPATREQPKREIPQREAPSRDIPQRETPQRETPQREAPQRDNNTNRESPRSTDSNRSGSFKGGSVSPPPPPPPPPSNSGSSSNKSNKHQLSMSKPSNNMITTFVKNVGKNVGSAVSTKNFSSSGGKSSGNKETKNNKV